MARKRTPSSSPPGRSESTCGWSSEAAIRDSRRKRSRKRSSWASSGAMTLSATLRPSPALLGAVDRAHAAAADERLDAVAREVASDHRVGGSAHAHSVGPWTVTQTAPSPAAMPPRLVADLDRRDDVAASPDRGGRRCGRGCSRPRPRSRRPRRGPARPRPERSPRSSVAGTPELRSATPCRRRSSRPRESAPAPRSRSEPRRPRPDSRPGPSRGRTR